MPSTNARLATDEDRRRERVLGPDGRRVATVASGDRGRSAPGSRGAIQRSNTRWSPLACGPASAATARRSASAGDEPGDAEHECGEQRHADHALRDPVGPGVDPFDRLIHRRDPIPADPTVRQLRCSAADTGLTSSPFGCFPKCTRDSLR